MVWRVTSIVNFAPWVTPTAPRGRRYSVPSSPVAIAFRPPVPLFARRALMMLCAGSSSSSSIRASMISPFSISAARTSPIPSSISQSRDGITCAFQKHSSFGKRKTDNIGIAAGDVSDIDFAIALERVSPGLAAPLAVTGIIVDLFLAKPLHCDHRFNQTLADVAARNCKCDAGQHPVAATRQQLHAGAQRDLVFDLGKDSAAHGNDRVRRKDQRVRFL